MANIVTLDKLLKSPPASAPAPSPAPRMERRKSVVSSTSVVSYWGEQRTILMLCGLLLCSVLVNVFFSSTIQPATFALNNAWSKRPNLVCDMDAISKSHLPTGKHHMVDLYGVPVENVRFLEESKMLTEVASYIAKAGLTLLDYSAYHFDCGGITAVFLLSESHVSFHSWPEHGFVALDVYTCGKGRPEHIVDKFKALLQPAAVRHTFLERGADRHLAMTTNSGNFGGIAANETESAAPIVRPVVASPPASAAEAAPVPSKADEVVQLAPGRVFPDVAPVAATEIMTKKLMGPSAPMDLCVNGDGPEDDCLLLRNAVVHADVQTPYQRIEIVDTQTLGRCMLLDRVVQFCEEDNHIYTSQITDRAMATLPADDGRKLNVTIIGGGDGWVASYLLDAYADRIESIRIVDIDEQVAKLTRTFFDPEGAAWSFTDPRVHWTFVDANVWLADLPAGVAPGSMDLVIIDCTDHTAEASKVLYTRDFYANVRRLMRAGAALTQQVNTVDPDYAPFFDTVRAQWADAGLNGLSEWTAYMQSFSGMSLFWLAHA
ncbi:hypothetical protein H9P43_010027 [Blastocladiella emersonii ATCC 22665]|nr:hypothetical protein H9P43_010027 [Blastocladiella emersonii ATCC 22665]